jgi:nucleoid DNA-binding protein
MASKIKITAAQKVRTKGSIYKDIAAITGLTRKQVVGVFDCLTDMMKADLGKKGCGTFNLLGLAKMRTVIKPATKARKGKNPFTGEEITIKAKPASRKVRVRAMKGLNDAV